MECSKRTCCAIGCENQGVLPFPKNMAIRKKWELALGRQNWKATQNSKLCINHFKPIDFIHKEVVARNNGLKLVTKILKKGVIPSKCLREIKSQNLKSPQHNVKNIPKILKKCKIKLNKQRNVQKPIETNKKQVHTGPSPKLYVPLDQVKRIAPGSYVSPSGAQKFIQKSNVSRSGHQIKTSYPFRVTDAKNIQEKNENEDVSLVMEVEEEMYPEIEYLDMEDFCSQDVELSLEKQASNTKTNTNSSGEQKIGTDPNIDCNDIKSLIPIHSTKKPDNSQPSKININQHFRKSISTQVNENVLPTQVSHKESTLRNQYFLPNTPQSTSKSILPVIQPATTSADRSQDTKRPIYVVPKSTSTDMSAVFRYYNKQKEKLNEKLEQLKKEYRRYYQTNKKRLERINKLKNFMAHPEFLKCNEKFAPTPKILTTCQIKLASKKAGGRRFNEEEKKLAKSLFEKNPSAYRFMNRIGFVLPSRTTLQLMQNPVESSEGRDEAVRKLKEKVKALKPTQRLCTLMFKEEILSPENRKQKIITTFGDNENEVVLEADHALLFMVRSITTRYKEPVSYTFSYGPTSETDLAAHIKNVISDLQVLGITVVATVCAHTDTNRRAIQILINEARCDSLMLGRRLDENVFMVNCKPIVSIYDPPHLLKGMRNHLMLKDLMYVVNGKSKVARWRYLEMVVKENPEINGERPIPKLTENLVYPTEDALNETKCAAQVFSQTVASYMGYLADTAILPPESQDTADLLLFFDQLFDSVNGFLANTNRKGKPLLYACKSKSPHTKKWTECIEVLQTMNFVENGCSVEVAELECWIWTLRSLALLANIMNNGYKVPKLWTRNLNQDMLERVFRMEVNPRKQKPKKMASVQDMTMQNEINELPRIENQENDKEVVTQKDINVSKFDYIIHRDGKVTKQCIEKSLPGLPSKENSSNSDKDVVTQKIMNRPIKIDNYHWGGKVVKQYGKKSLPSKPKIENSSGCQTKVIQRQPNIENSSAARDEELISLNPVSRLPSLPVLEI